MPQIPKIPRRPLKVHPEPEALLESIARSLATIAQGVKDIVETLDAIVSTNDKGQPHVRVVQQ